MFIVALNGPPRSGKDTVANYLIDNLTYPTIHMKFSLPLKRATHALFRLDLDADYEETKDVPTDDFLGLTPRQAYIEMSESYLKCLCGQEALGEIGVRTLNAIYDACTGRVGNTRSLAVPLIVISDCGFSAELAPMLTKMNDTVSLLIIQLFRYGYDFSNDSRSYVTLNGIMRYVDEQQVSLFKEPRIVQLENKENEINNTGIKALAFIKDMWGIE